MNIRVLPGRGEIKYLRSMLIDRIALGSSFDANESMHPSLGYNASSAYSTACRRLLTRYQ